MAVWAEVLPPAGEEAPPLPAAPVEGDGGCLARGRRSARWWRPAAPSGSTAPSRSMNWRASRQPGEVVQLHQLGLERVCAGSPSSSASRPSPRAGAGRALASTAWPRCRPVTARPRRSGKGAAVIAAQPRPCYAARRRTQPRPEPFLCECRRGEPWAGRRIEPETGRPLKGGSRLRAAGHGAAQRGAGADDQRAHYLGDGPAGMASDAARQIAQLPGAGAGCRPRTSGVLHDRQAPRRPRPAAGRAASDAHMLSPDIDDCYDFDWGRPASTEERWWVAEDVIEWVVRQKCRARRERLNAGRAVGCLATTRS